MSVTSDRTAVEQPDGDEASTMSSPDCNNIATGTVREVGEVQSAMNKCAVEIYDAYIRAWLDYGETLETATFRGYIKAESFVYDLLNIGQLVGRCPEEGYVEVVEFVIDTLTEISSQLAASESKSTDSAAAVFAQSSAIVYTSLAQAQLRFGHNAAAAAVFRDPKWELVLRNATRLHAIANHDDRHAVSKAYCALISVFMRSVSAVFGSAAAMAMVYGTYSTQRLMDTLDKGFGDLVKVREDIARHGLSNSDYCDPVTTWTPGPEPGRFRMHVSYRRGSPPKQATAESKTKAIHSPRVQNKKRSWYQVFGGD